jgi:ABC-type glycerol-3-phosphate transport system permease component
VAVTETRTPADRAVTTEVARPRRRQRGRVGLAIGLQFLKGQYTTDYGALMAMTLLSVAPLVILFLAFQRFFVQGLATTGLK